MPVYVDKARNPHRGMIMCHMLADTLDELHAMALRIGMKRAWFQDKPGKPHYDVSLERRALAVRFGAIEIDRREVVAVLRRIRSSGCAV